jgi:hypothetical protein
MNPSRKTLIIIYLVFLVLFFWLQASKQAAPVPPAVRIVASAKNYTLPLTPVVSLINETDKEITVDTCRDIQVVANGVQKTALPQAFCRTVIAPPKSTTPLLGTAKEDIFEFQESFANIPKVTLSFVYTQPETSAPTEAVITIGHAG